MRALCKTGMLGKPSKLSKLGRKSTIASFPHSLQKGAGWYEEQDESSRPHYVELGSFRERIPSLVKSVGRTLTGTREIKSNPMLRQPNSMETSAKFRNKNKYREYHKDYGHTTSECHECKKSLRRGDDHNRLNPKEKKDHDANYNTEIIVTIIGGIDDKELNIRYWKAHIRKLSHVMINEIAPWTNHDRLVQRMHPLQTPHNDALVIQLKIATAIGVLLISIITLECLEKLQYRDKDLEVVEIPIVGFWRQATYPLRTKRLPI
ncbi:LOW QUALITY PROTEIN: hypothetical protein Cgig2_002953 [Carnegiea gigantea]|uniref:Uncharacterized protein n=1 Tax=Carnegiea gigantea TaxID=171969 RepID=A0A9Q1JIT3_9CARY|nr:LOW QUALITY PROTEIN: hypothetical protein Cgig2_002953 [Carnegiea gigantea]